MRKIKYPSDRDKFEKEYLAEFADCDLQSLWVPLRNILLGWSMHAEKNDLYPVEIA